MTGEEIDPYPTPAVGDFARQVGEAIVQLVPVVGGSAVTFAGIVVEPKLEKRRDRWFDIVGRRLQEALDRIEGLEIEHLQSNDLLVTQILVATEAAQRTHDDEKLEALANVAVRAALPNGLDEQWAMMMLRLVDELTPLHFQILVYLCDPPGWFEMHDQPLPNIGGSRGAVFNVAFPALAEAAMLAGRLLAELESRGLMTGPLSGMVSDVFTPMASGLGKMLVAFIEPAWPAG